VDRFRLGVDIGGTFTDFVLLNESSGALDILKIPTTPRAPASAVTEGVRMLARRLGIDPAAIDYFVHGTTLAVNTLIERSGSPTGLLVTSGLEDILELRRLRLPDPQNFFTDPPAPLAPREAVRGIDERLGPTGTVERAVDLDEAEAKAADLVAAGCRALAICFLHAYANDAHEAAVKQRVAARFPDLFVCTSSEVWPQRREYERTLLTTINAHVGERMRSYFRALERELRGLGITSPILSTKSNGGVMTARTAGERSVETLFSGPASGVIGAHWVATQAGFPHVITFDMGGTSADVSVITDRPSFSSEAQAGDFPILMPSIDVKSVGAGGGSIAWVDRSGVLKVGPHSAGSEPGPASYGRGGAEPTVTDAYLALGWLNPERFAGGDVRLDRGAARDALARLGDRLGMGVEDIAWAIVEVATANMYARFMPFLTSRGVNAEDYAIVAYGGAGPTHACLLAQELGLTRVLVPRVPGALCALGCLVADLRADFVRVSGARCDHLAPAALEQAFLRLESDARAWLQREGLAVAAYRFERSADMRYVGQSFELTAPLPDRVTDTLAPTLEAFYRVYQDVYGYVDRDAPVEIVDLRMQVVGLTPKPRAVAGHPNGGTAAEGGPAPRRRLYWAGRTVDAVVYQRAALRRRDRMTGPVVIEQDDTTTLVPAGFAVRVDEQLNVIAEALPV